MKDLLEEYYARDRRVYNGALCSDLEKEIKHTDYLVERMKKADSTARCVYFPVEGAFLVFINSNTLENPNLKGPPKELTGIFHYRKQQALIEAIITLESN